MPTANVDHTISGQGTAVSTLVHLATTPRATTMLTLTIISVILSIPLDTCVNIALWEGNVDKLTENIISL